MSKSFWRTSGRPSGGLKGDLTRWRCKLEGYSPGRLTTCTVQAAVQQLSRPVISQPCKAKAGRPSTPATCAMQEGEGRHGGMLATLQEQDKQVSLKLYQKVGARLPRSIMMLLEHSGSGVLWLPVVPALWILRSLSPETRQYWANAFLLLWVDIVLTGLLKAIARRTRPIYNHVGDFVVIVAVDQYSFPSGHAARVSCLAVLACVCCLPHHWAFALLAGLWAVAVALSRAVMGRHYLGDVLAGLLLGIVSAGVVTRGLFSTEGLWIGLTTSEHWHAQALKSLGQWSSYF